LWNEKKEVYLNCQDEILALSHGHLYKPIEKAIESFSAMGEIFDDCLIASGRSFCAEFSLFAADDNMRPAPLPLEKNDHLLAGRKFRQSRHALRYLAHRSAGLLDGHNGDSRSFELAGDGNSNHGGYGAAIGRLANFNFFDPALDDDIGFVDEPAEG